VVDGAKAKERRFLRNEMGWSVREITHSRAANWSSKCQRGAVENVASISASTLLAKRVPGIGEIRRAMPAPVYRKFSTSIMSELDRSICV
jgi:hypothetical protein